jgi:hypothetical protein
MCCGSTWVFFFGAEPGQHSIEVFRHFLLQLTIINSWNHSSSLLNCLMDYQLLIKTIQLLGYPPFRKPPDEFLIETI